jgi:hypothetical protein
MARRKTKDKGDELLEAMRRAIMTVLNDPKADLIDRTKAIEAGAKVLAIEYKVREKRARHGSFFAAGGSAEN